MTNEIKETFNLTPPNRIIFDIETCPLEIDEETGKGIGPLRGGDIGPSDTAGLDPFHSRIVCIGILEADWDLTKYDTRVLLQEDEKALLQEFWEYLGKRRPTTMYGFNSFRFDWWFLKVRSLAHRLKIYKHPIYHKDLMTDSDIWPKGVKWRGLQKYADLLGLEGKSGSGVRVQQLWTSGKHDELKEYCRQDCITTFELMKTLKDCDFID
jgi:DNA polymerase elongation subunit (family B)